MLSAIISLHNEKKRKKKEKKPYTCMSKYIAIPKALSNKELIYTCTEKMK